MKGHAGHDESEDKSKQIPTLRHNEHLFDLNGQINHKVSILAWRINLYIIFFQMNFRLSLSAKTFHPM